MAGKKLPFIQANNAPPKPPSALEIFKEVWSDVRLIVCLFFGVTLLSALLYFWGSASGWGICSTYGGNPDTSANAGPGFLDCLYFSVVTIATLGYGDYRPMAFGRVVAAGEVLAGIILMGMFVSRLVSRQQDRMARRLVRGQYNTEIQSFRDQLKVLLGNSLESTAALHAGRPSIFLHKARGLATAIARYWRHETLEPNLRLFLPIRAAGRLVGELIDLLENVKTLTLGKTVKDLSLEDFRAIRTLTESILLVATILHERTQDPGLKHSYERVTQTVNMLRKQLSLKRKEVAIWNVKR